MHTVEKRKSFAANATRRFVVRILVKMSHHPSLKVKCILAILLGLIGIFCNGENVVYVGGAFEEGTHVSAESVKSLKLGVQYWVIMGIEIATVTVL